MTSTADSLPSPDLPEPPGENPHYLHAVTELGEEQVIMVNDDVYATNGMKLLAKGARINRKQFDRLVQHKLTVSLDSSLALERAVDAAELSREAGRLLERDARMASLAARGGDPLAVKHELASLHLPAPLPTRLTVMQTQRPDLFQHSVRTAMIAFALGQRLKLPASELPLLLLAALCHDMGELHTDPALLAASHQIAPEERRYLHVHPITSYLLLKEIKDFSPAEAQAVLQHHERLDGSGYPYGLKSAQISSLAKVLAVADVAEAVIDRLEPKRLDMLLRMGQTRFAPEIVNALRDLIRAPDHETPEAVTELDTAAQLDKLAKLLGTWFTLSKMLESQGVSATPNNSPLGFLFERMDGIRRLILQAGFDPGDIQGMAAIAGNDAQILAELRDMLEEIDWLFGDLANEIERRSPELDGISTAALGELVEQLRPN
ncbi:MAG: HD domain-containing phosphohydrolase [Pseudomonadota bacterium]